MKKIGIVLLIAVALALVVGCASSGGGSGSSSKAEVKPLYVDVSKLELTKNAKVFAKAYDDLLIPLPEFPGVDFTKFRRITVQGKFFDKNNREVQPTWNANAMVSLVYDKDVEDKDLRNGPNVPFKTFNVGMDKISSEEGETMILGKPPAAVLIQNNHTDIGYFQLTALIFHNNNLAPPAEATSAGTLPPFDLVLADNFQYGETYQGKVTNADMLGGHRLAVGETYTLEITYTASRDLEKVINIGFVDTSAAANYWKPLSWDAKVTEWAPTTTPASKANSSVSQTLTLTIVANPTGASTAANALVFETNGAGRKGTANSGVQKPVTLKFTKFVLTKN
jgi:hypothetical protein